MKFLKYIWNNPFKLAYVVFISLVILGCATQIFKYWEDLNIITNITLCVFMTVIYGVSMYHPYKEWKDSLNSNK